MRIQKKAERMGIYKLPFSKEFEKNQIIKLFIKYYCTEEIDERLEDEGLSGIYKLIADNIGLSVSSVSRHIKENYPLAVPDLTKRFKNKSKRKKQITT